MTPANKLCHFGQCRQLDRFLDFFSSILLSAQGGGGMSQWMLRCSACGREFSYSSIPDSRDLLPLELPHKPEFPPWGLDLGCPHCRESASYQRRDLIYRDSPAFQVQ